MIGDMVLIYDEDRGFFVDWRRSIRTGVGNVSEPKWSFLVDEARKMTVLKHAERVLNAVGGKARIVSETKARQIEAMHKYKEVRMHGGSIARGQG